MIRTLARSIALGAIAIGAAVPIAAQENYEIQVYASELVPKGVTIYELHSNFTRLGRRFTSVDGEFPTFHALHETVEITRGLTDWSELGFYWFMAVPDGRGFHWVGSHIRPRVTVPDSWGWPVGVSISQEIGYARKEFSADTWTYELRPIIDKQLGPWYLGINPVLGKSLRGPNAAESFDFSPNVNIGYDLTPKLNVAMEYYGNTGTLRGLAPIEEQEHVLYGAVNVDFGPEWEFNFGYGTALTAGGDKNVIKMIVGRRFGLRKVK